MSAQNVVNTNELYAQYDWYAKSYPSVIQNASDEFFLPGFQFILLGISKNINMLMDKDSYFVTKIMIDAQYDIFFRSAEKTISIILDKALGKANGKFNLNKLTDLEAKIITAFNDYVYNSLTKLLAPAPPTLKRTNFDVIHLTFLLKDIEKNTTGKFIVTLPDVLLKPDIITSQEEKFNEDDFATSKIDVNIEVGSTKFKLIDIKHIEKDDIVVFDNSNSHHMILKFKDYEKEININPNLGLVIPFDNEGGEDEMEENTNLWDSIEVEMTAKFDTVKITLGELKNIEKGLVVDLTSIYDNKITLSVEDKAIARGELVIVNDRYGVKIEEVVAGKEEITPEENIVENSEQITEEQEVSPAEQIEENNVPEENNNNQNEEEEFDYSDFELEDEDI